MDADSEKFTALGQGIVKGFALDLSQPDSIAPAFKQITDALGRIDVAIYNAAYFNVNYEDDVDAFIKGSNVNIVSMHATLSALIPQWKAAGRGVFLLSGGGFAIDGKQQL